jgi:hypothetical protein
LVSYTKGRTQLRVFEGDQIKENEMGGVLAGVEEMRNAYKILVRKSEGKKPLGRPRHRW